MDRTDPARGAGGGVRRDRLTALTLDMIAADTSNPPGGETEIVALLAGTVAEMGLEHTVFEVVPGRPSLLARYRAPGDGAPTLMLNGHIDVVPALPEEWSVPPFAGVERDGRIIGRGSCDMKGGIAAALEALRACLDVGRPPECDIVFHLVSDEETGGVAGTRALVEAGLVAADACLVPEPTDLHLGVAERGAILGQIVVRGEPGHGSEPAAGRSAVQEAARIVEALHLGRFQGLSHPLLGTPTCNVGTIVGGTSPNVIASSCTIGFDRRFLPGQTADELVAEILRIAASVTDAPFEVITGTVIEASELDADHALVGHLGRICAERGRPARVVGSSLGSDARFLRNVCGIPAVVWGPGSPARAHTIDEWVAVDDLVCAATLFADVYASFPALIRRTEAPG